MSLLERIGSWFRLAAYLGRSPVTLAGAVHPTSSAITLIGFWLLDLAVGATLPPYMGLIFFLVLPRNIRNRAAAHAGGSAVAPLPAHPAGATARTIPKSGLFDFVGAPGSYMGDRTDGGERNYFQYRFLSAWVEWIRPSSAGKRATR